MPGLIPLIGEKFPEIVVETSHGIRKLPDEYRGKWLILFSHPADFTPVCTTEFVAFAKRYEDFKKLNAELLGLSVDSTYSHIKWIEWIEKNLGVKIPFPIIADPGGEVSKKLGFLHAQSATHTVRSVIIVDPEGIIRAILYYPQEAGRNIDEILRLLKVLQLNNKYGRALPANWPNNELVGDSVIVPPARTVAEAEERLKKFKCYDWWFCYEEHIVPIEEVEEVRKWLERASKPAK
ncbi:MAG: peroxiredoxin [Desulfurococcaceae archaeon]|jgi:peroxiredoxin (alkyl hydroperoxide reductase subunit C)|nr:peroxiredoxin [Desulfurococcaceae archaeon]